jgi:hypothetical protein
MEKLVYILWKPAGSSESEFAQTLRLETAAQLGELGAKRLALNIVDEEVAHTKNVRMTNFDPPMAAMASFWLDDAEERAALEAELVGVCSQLAGYLVVESVPLVNTTHRTEPCQRTPGINVVACIERPASMDHDEWLGHWFGHHKVVALETQCTYAYVRNVVVRHLTDNAPDWAGIVEEGFPAEAVTDPMVWYCTDGDQKKLKENLGRMMESVNAFLEIDRVESHPMSEYLMSDG